MNVTVKIFYSDNEFTPAIYFCDWFAAWQLWFTLTKSMIKGESAPHVLKVEIWDGGNRLEPEKGIVNCGLSQQYRKS